ncbi:hypothetical protein LINGRAHAP2_LOCUS24479 [Linum grandiflorum]
MCNSSSGMYNSSDNSSTGNFFVKLNVGKEANFCCKHLLKPRSRQVSRIDKC